MNKTIRKGFFLNLLICVFLIASNTNLFAQERNIEDITVENAAVYYLKAFELMHYPDSPEVIKKLRRVIKNGWQEDKELEELLNQNEMCFKEFKKGVLLKKCDFNFGKKEGLPPELEVVHGFKIIHLSELLLLKGRYLEKKENFDEAIDLYLSLLTFAFHISQDNSLLSQLIALRRKKDVYAILEDYLNSQKATKRNALKILNYLEDYDKQCVSIEQVLEKEKKKFISSLQMIVDNINAEKGLNTEERKKALEFGDEILKQGHLLADYYYGRLIKLFEKATKTNDEADWNAVSREIQSWEEKAKRIGKVFWDRGIEKKGFDKKVARQIVKTTFFLTFSPYIKKVIDEYRLTQKKLKELKSLADVKAR